MWDVGCVLWLLLRRRRTNGEVHCETATRRQQAVECWQWIYTVPKFEVRLRVRAFILRERARLRAIAASFVFAPPFKFQFVLLSLVPLLSSPSVAPDRWHFSLRCSYNLQHVMKLANLISKPFLQNDDNIQQNKQNLYRLWPFGNLCSCPESKSKCRRSWFLHLILDGYRQFVSPSRRHPRSGIQ